MAFFQTKHLWIKQLADGVAVLMLDRDQSATNLLDVAMLDDLERALDAFQKDGSFRLLVIRSAKSTDFCHGPSPAMVASWKLDDFRTWAQRGQQVCNMLVQMPVASACVIAGSCFDAGLELALACDHRVVVNKTTTTLGFPELEWAMIPCWGSTQRLPRLIGLDNSLHMLLAGQRYDAREAWQHNLADDLTEEASEEPPAFLANPTKRDWSAFPRRNWRERWLESNPLGRWFLFRGAERILRTRIPDEMPAPAEMLQALRIAFQNASMAPGQDFERQALDRIAVHPALGQMLRLLQHRDKLRMQPIASGSHRHFHTIGINGTDTVGLSLLLHCLVKGHHIVLRAADATALGTALGHVVQLLHAEVERGAMTLATLQKLQAAIRGTFTWTHFDKVDLLLDTTLGTLEEKQLLYQEMEPQMSTGALIAPTAGVYRIEDLRGGLRQPERVVGVHIIEPWNRASVAEIATPATGQHNVQRVRNWAVDLGKYCLHVPDGVGGVVMRVWLPALNEAGILIKEGVPIDRIDLALRRFGMSFGPCEWMDRVGVDQVAALVHAMRPAFVSRIAFETGFARMGEQQLLGAKTERGFYRAGLRKKKPNPEAIALWQTQSQGTTAKSVPVLAKADAHLWIQRRLVTLMLLEALRCLDDGVINDADDLDCAMCLTNWATHRGGPIGHARHLGVAAFTERCDELTREYGPRFAFFANAERFF